MPRGNFDLCRSTPLLVLLWRERLLKPGPDVGRNVPVRLNFVFFFFIFNSFSMAIGFFRGQSESDQTKKSGECVLNV